MLEAAMWSSFSVTLFTFFHHCFGHSGGGRKEITHLSFSWMTAAISSVPTTAHHISWKIRQTATRQTWQLCAMQQRNSEMHRAEDLACKLFVSVVIAINQSMFNAISFNSLTLCCHISITLSSLLSPDFTSLLPSLFPPHCHLPPKSHDAWANRKPNIFVHEFKALTRTSDWELLQAPLAQYCPESDGGHWTLLKQSLQLDGNS